MPVTTTPNVDIFSGVDVPPVMDDADGAYTLYNGGVYDPSSTDGGARLAGVDVTVTSGSPIAPAWDYSLDARANNVQQLSTPYLDASGEENVLYAATTYLTNELSGATLAGWTDASGNQLSSPISINPGSTATIYYSGLIVPSGFWQPQIATDIVCAPFAATTGSVTLTPRNGDPVINWGTSFYFQGNFTLFNNSGLMIPAGQYDIAVTISIANTEPNPVDLESIEFLTSRWSLYEVTGFDANTAPTGKAMLATGYGQATTPIYFAEDGGNDYLYFGIYEGDRSYYQYDTTGTIALEQFTPAGGDDFYWAGALDVEIAGIPHVAFGSESGTIYVRPVGTTFDSGAGYTVDLTTVEPDAGRIRSTIMSDGTTYGYLTSVGTGGVGYLWRIDVAGNLDAIELPSNSTSTPVLSDSGYIYVGYYDFNVFPSEGGVVGVLASGFTTLFDMYGNGVDPMVGTPGDPVQSSPIVWNDEDDEIDYVYFTTNADNSPAINHNGYCYEVDVSGTPVPNLAWNPSTGGTYALQGFASDNGYVVYGDDSNTLYIFSK